MENIQRFTLSNGMKVIYLKKPIDTVSMVLCVGIGFLDDEEGSVGVSHLLEHMLFDGTKKYPSEFIFNDAVEQIGGEINGVTEERLTAYEIKVAKNDFPKALELFGEMFQHPLLLEKDIEKEKKVIKAELLERRDYFKKNPVRAVLHNYLDGFNNREYLEKEIKELDDLNKEKLLKHLNKGYFPKNMVVGIVGNVENLKSLIEKEFNQLKQSNYAREIPHFKSPGKVVERVEDKDEVSSVYFCWFGPGEYDEEKAVFEVCSSIISKGKDGLVKEIRFDQGLAYDVAAGIETEKRKGEFIVSVKTNHDNLGKIENIVKEKVNLLKSVDEESVERAKKSVLAKITLENEQYINVATEIAEAELYGEKTPFEGYEEKVKRVSVQQVKDFAKKYFGEEFVVITSKKKEVSP